MHDISRRPRRPALTTVDLGNAVADALIRGGIIRGVAAQHPFEQGHAAALAAVAALTGQPVPRWIVLPGLSVTTANVVNTYRAVGGNPASPALMNGEPLTREHGAPLRIVVPGYAGVRSPKWLRSITVQDRPSDAFQQAEDYLLFPPGARKETKAAFEGVTITEMPLTSAICEPQPGATLAAGPTTVRGYAIATDRAIVRVDVSANGGRDWVQATIEDHGNRRWSWTLWHATLDLPKGGHELAVRAWDAPGQTQPALPEDTWNFKGYLGTAWHRVRVMAE